MVVGRVMLGHNGAMDDAIAPILAAAQAGAFDRAEALVAPLIASENAAPPLLHLAGQIALQIGDTAAACARLARARNGDRGNPQFANDLGVALRYANRPIEAAREFAAAVALVDTYQQAWHNLGMTRRALGDLAGADQALARAAQLAPDPASHIALGAVRLARGDAAGAEAALARAAELAPDAVEPAMYRALALHRLDRAEEADAAIARALAVRPEAAAVHNILGMIAADRGEDDAAFASFRAAVRLAPDDPALLANLGAALARREDPDAAATLEAAIARAPDNADALYALGIVRHRAGEWAAARLLLSRAPDHALAAAALLMDAQYESDQTGESLCAAARQWGERFARPARAYRDWPNARDPNRRLRVGFVSPDFRDHSCAFFLEPLFAALDRTQIEVFAYAELRRPDAVTERFRRLADRFALTRGVSDAALAARVREDAIDVLIDCAGHSADNRLAMMALHPAPVQATWLGYPGTTGAPAIAWRISDAICDPAGEAHTTETLIRLPHALLCYAPPENAPAVAIRPAGPVVFGSFNNARKLSAATLGVWARILRDAPDATLLLKAKDMAKPPVAQAIRAAFAQAGIDAGRVTLIDWIDDPAGHLAAYGRIDVALDPFPYAGTTTTCEALWMGAPVVTLKGQRHAARVGASLLACVGLEELVASDVDDYVARTVALTRDPVRRQELRSSLRERMKASPLCDAAAFARAFEAAIRAMWRAWLASPGPERL